MKNKNVLISGASIAGLTLAYWLKRYGFVPTLVERHPTLRTGGYKIDIRGVALDVVKRMEADALIFASRTDIQGATIVDSSGKHITEMSGDLCGSRTEGDFEIMRGDLCRILLKQVGDVECLFGDTITHISQNEEGVHVEFERNTPRQFDLVIGADGLHSMVRKLVFGDESLFLKELGLYISVYTIPNFLNLDRREIEYYEPQKFVNVYSTRGDSHAKACFAFFSKRLQFDPRNIEQQKKILKDAFTGIGWEVPRLLAEMKESPDFYFDLIAQTHMPHWTKQRVALAGDAGYAPSPLTGQGTSLAIVGAYVLAGELAEAQGDYNKAFSNYEKLLRKFVTKNQKIAEMNVKIMSGEDTSVFTWLNRLLMRLMPDSWIQLLKKWGLKRIQNAANAFLLKNYLENIATYFGDVLLKKSGIGQFKDGLGVFADRDFKKDDVVLKWKLKSLTEEEFKRLPEYERTNFCHRRNGIIYLYPVPERHVNRSKNPNVVPDFEKEANIALRDIQKGEELSILDTIKEDFDNN